MSSIAPLKPIAEWYEERAECHKLKNEYELALKTIPKS